jgi:hypothetical protein
MYILIGITLFAALVIGKFMLDKQSQHFPGHNELSVAELKESGTSLSGNEYRVSGKIVERMILRGERGLLISVQPKAEGSGTNLIPVHVPPGTERINLERGQQYSFKVEVNREGLPVALDIQAY